MRALFSKRGRDFKYKQPRKDGLCAICQAPNSVLAKSNLYPFNIVVYHLHHKRRNHKNEIRYRSLHCLQCILIPLHISLYSSLLCHLRFYVNLYILLHSHGKRVSVLLCPAHTTKKSWPLMDQENLSHSIGGHSFLLILPTYPFSIQSIRYAYRRICSRRRRSTRIMISSE